ncbi:MAG TPA: hypothetical protein ENK07_02080 [Bacteroidetes bacterium]|nr:hypothetical protein [Bacteroidota bacterium]
MAEIRKLDVGQRYGIQGVHIPTFDEILDLVRGRCGVYLDLKRARIAPLVEKIRKRRMETDVVWCLSDLGEIQKLQALCPDCVVMPDPESLPELRSVLSRYHPLVVAPVWKELTREMSDLCHRYDALVFVDENWHNPRPSWKQALAWGVDGIQTDEPEELIAWLRSRPLKVW